jgi:glutamate synthase (NADPH/NADH) small chain
VEFLHRVNAGERLEVGETVVVVGGGDTAVDAARVTARLGAKTTILYRRTIQEMPAIKEEVEEAEREGVEIKFLAAPTAVVTDNGRATGLTCLRMELGEPDKSGRRRPVPIPGSEFEIPVDVAIVAIGTTANPLVQATTPGLKTNKRNYIVADPETMRTSREGVFAGGDIVTGAATVILAMGAGRKAAASIHEWLSTGVWETQPAAQAAVEQPV